MQKGYVTPSYLNLYTIGLADADIARGDLATADKALDLVELRQEVEEHFKTGPTPAAKANRLILTAYLRYLQGRSSAALDLYTEALPICRILGEPDGKTYRDHPLTAFALDGLADLALEDNRLDSAEKLFKESLAIREKTLGRDHRDVSYSLDGLGRVVKAKGKDQEADSYFDRASAILIRALGSAHPDVRDLERHRTEKSVTLAELKLKHSQTPIQKQSARAIRTNRFLTLPTLLPLIGSVGDWNPPANWPNYEKTLRRREAAHPKPPAGKAKEAKSK